MLLDHRFALFTKCDPALGELLDLNTITNVPGTLVEAMGINEQGDIVGSYRDLNNHTRGFVLKQQ